MRIRPVGAGGEPLNFGRLVNPLSTRGAYCAPPPALLLAPLNFWPPYSTARIFIIVVVVGVQEVNIHTYFMPEHKVLQPCTSVHTAYTDTSYEVLKSKNAKKKSCQIVLFSCNFEPFCFLIDCWVSFLWAWYGNSTVMSDHVNNTAHVFSKLKWSLCPLANS